MAKRRILIQLDTDPHPSVFDAVVAVDSGVEVLLQYGGVTPEAVRDLVYGAIFTRGPADLHSTALFVGGSDLAQGEKVVAAARGAFLGKLRVSLMLDSSGANTTAAAAVAAALRHLGRPGEPAAAALGGRRAVVLGGTGSVGRRVARLLARLGARVVLTSRAPERAERAAGAVREAVPGAAVEARAAAGGAEVAQALEGAVVVVAAGGPGVELLAWPALEEAAGGGLEVALDLNAVPPAGIEGIEPRAAGARLGGVVAYGAIGVGEIKMAVHKACVASLFEARDRVLDAEEILESALALAPGGPGGG